ncbi:MAG TPA: sigma-70 family RNA polymerase sigma factor [Chloroflexota bacterium]|nr:sigma-70 family RNA polymerase sigma factor [Chloroflexota bacterium]
MEDAFQSRAFIPDDTDTDDAAIAEAAKTDAHAFGDLYERYYPRVYRYVYHRLGNVTEAEDVTAVVFMKALEGLPGYRPRRTGFAPWLFRIARNAVVDHYRRVRRAEPLDGNEHYTVGDDPVADFLRGERTDELNRLVSLLSGDQRDVVLLRFAADLSYGEIAATVGKNEPAVRMLLHRALRKLRTVIDDARI